MLQERKIIGFKLSPDDGFGDWEPQKEKPGLAPAIRTIIKKLEEFIAVLWSVKSTGIICMPETMEITNCTGGFLMYLSQKLKKPW